MDELPSLPATADNDADPAASGTDSSVNETKEHSPAVESCKSAAAEQCPNGSGNGAVDAGGVNGVSGGHGDGHGSAGGADEEVPQEQDAASLRAHHTLQEELSASRLRDLMAANNELKDRVSGLLADLESRSKDLDESRQQNAHRGQEADTKHQHLAKDLEQLRANFEEKESAAGKARKEWEAERKQLQEQLKTAERGTQQLRTEHDAAVNSAQKGHQSELDKMKKQLAEVEGRAKSLDEVLATKEEERATAVAEKGKAERLMQQHRQDAEKSKAEVKSLGAEVHKWQTNYESVQTLLNDTQKQSAKGKDDVKSQFIKLSWAQNKLKAETEAHKETKRTLETTSKQLDTTQQEMDKLKKQYDISMTDVRDQSVRSSTQLDQRIKDLEVDVKKRVEEIAVERQAHKVTAQQLLDAQGQLKVAAEEVEGAKETVEEKSKAVEELQNNVSKEHDRYEETQRECERLNSRISEIGELRQQLAQERERVTTLSTELGEVLASRSELEGEVGERQQREGEMLSFHQRMAAMNAELQSQQTKLSDDVVMMRNTNTDLRLDRDRFKEERDRLQRELDNLQQQYKTEVTTLSCKVDDKTKAVEQLTVLLDDERGEVRVLKKKNATSVKDLTRQLLQARKAVDALRSGDMDLEEFRQTSRGGSSLQRFSSDSDLAVSSVMALELPLSDGTRAHSPPGAPPSHRSRSLSANRVISNSRYTPDVPHSYADERPRHALSVSPEAMPTPSIESVSIQRPPAVIEKERRMLLNKIGSLQNAHASKDEKIEFMESHIAELTDEVRRKTKAIQALVLRQDSGSISPASQDTYKLQSGPQRGVMASVFHSRKHDQKLTLGLSLEINSKMQAVLEDLLVKNMTLKDNLSTLGQEVADLLSIIKQHNIRVPRRFR